MDAEKILESLPRFNSLQIIVLVSVGCLLFRAPWQIFGISFLAQESANFTCSLAQHENESLIAGECDITNPQTNESLKCSEWDYIDMPKAGSIATEWDLVCGSQFFVTLEQTLYVAGQMVGALFLAPLSDRFGRRKAILIALFLHLCLSIVLMFSVNIYMFTVVRFLMGTVNQLIVTSSYVLMAEWASVKYRTVATNSIMVFWVFGIMAMPGLAYFIREWRPLILAYSIIPNCIVFVLYFILPESLFYLIANGKYQEVEKTLKRVDWSSNKSAGVTTMTMVKRASQADLATREKVQEEAHESMLQAIKDIVTSPRMATYSLGLFWISICLNLIYYITTLMAGELSGDMYVNFVLSGVVELPFVIASMILSLFTPRTVLLVSLYSVAFVSLLVFSLTGETVAAYFGRGAISGCYIVGVLYATEMFPTIVRNAGLGFYQVAENLGPVIAGPISTLAWDSSGPGSFYFFLSIITLANGVIVSLMPETKQYVLPETVEEIESRQAFSFWRYLVCAHEKPPSEEEKTKPAVGNVNPHLEAEMETFEF